MRPGLRRFLLEPTSRRARLTTVAIGLTYAVLGVGAVFGVLFVTQSKIDALITFLVIFGVVVVAIIVVLILWAVAVHTK